MEWVEARRRKGAITRGSALRFDIGQVNRTFAVPLLGDTMVEGDETVLLTLTNPINAVLGLPSTATLTIIDNVFRLPIVMRGYLG